jgi:molybdate transport system substrate-binding protein
MSKASLIRQVMVSAVLLFPFAALADEIRVAVASNFTNPMRTIAERFEAQTGHKVVLAFGSTGKQYTQIKNGAPFDAFFAADTLRPALLEREGAAVSGSRFIYAVGRIVLWSPRAGYVDPEGRVLERDDFEHLAIANPKLAPYGKAAQEVLVKRGLWKSLSDRIVVGETVGQTFQFVKTANAELGFVAMSYVIRPGHASHGSHWEIPQALYEPIEQQAVLLRDTAAAKAFLEFSKGETARSIMSQYGYGTPQVPENDGAE